MFIKEINITGFRSYKELTTIGDFSPKHNVVVGRNGSGKSNFFFAIQFVLSNEFNTLNQEQRNNLLHEGTGSRAAHARVEIVFDNSFRRLPSESNEVRIARQVSSKKDQYFIDNKAATRTDIMNLLESAGISRSNPYYIVKQGKVMELATQANSQRLKLIREVAGTRVFDERKEESVKLLKETQAKLEKCKQLLGYMEDRLKKLEEEKEDLKEYQKYDKMKRAIEYTINNVESENCNSKIDEQTRKRQQQNARQNEIDTRMITIQQAILTAQTAIRKLEQDVKVVEDSRDMLSDEQNKLMSVKAELELAMKDLVEELDRERDSRDKSKDDLSSLNEQIRQRQEELEELEPRFVKLMEEETTLRTDIKIFEQKISELNSKQGQKDQFDSMEARDKFLNREVNNTTRQINHIKDQVREIDDAIANDEAELENLNEAYMACDRELRDRTSEVDKVNAELTQKRIEVDRLSNQLKDAQMKENDAANLLNQLKDDVSAAENSLMALAPKSVMNGTRSVKFVLDWMKQNNDNRRYDDVISGYYGQVYEHLRTEDQYNLAVDVTAQNRLFYHVVRDDQVANRIISQLNTRELRGEFNFFPLNRLSKKPCRDVPEGDAIPLLKLIHYDEMYDDVMRLIFADTVLVPDLSVGARVARNDRLNCVTTNGDQINRRGPLTGGYLDRKKSKLETAARLHSYRESLVEAKESYENACSQAKRLRSKFESTMMDMHNVEGRAHNLKQQLQTANDRRHNISDQLNSRGIGREPKTAQKAELNSRIRELEARKEILQKQLGTPLLSQLSSDEKAELANLQVEIDRQKSRLRTTTGHKQDAERRKRALEHQLHSNLLRRRDGLQSNLQDMSIKERNHQIDVKNAELSQINERLAKLATELNSKASRIHELRSQQDVLQKELDNHMETRAKLDEEIEAIAKVTDACCTKIADYQAKMDEYSKKMNEIGMVPADALRKYSSMSLKVLDKKLTECMTQLKKYENVNKKAFDQFVRANTQKEGLAKSLDELTRNEQSINSLINVLENRRQETLNLTLKQVAKNFGEVFKQLIPDGKAELVIQVDDSAESGSSQDPSRYTGVAIAVSFTGAEETKEMNHLSGGQKSLVALALIFAIQKCDPAPFYLFDEIDAALDRQHRQSVAAMIHELSENAQFITTTFRPELLEHAEKFYGVRFRNKVSYIDPTTREEAYDFVTDDQTYG